MSEERSRLEELLRDTSAFRLMLDGAFRDWEGTYDVLLADTGKYLFRSMDQPRFRPFCRKLRSEPAGEALCQECDQEAAIRAAEEQQPIVYSCHAGLRDVAVPIIVDDEAIATVFCGQVRTAQDEADALGLATAQQLESQLGFAPGELSDLWEQVPRVPEDTINLTVSRVWTLIQYVSGLAHERQELAYAHRKDQQRLRESEAIEAAARKLGALAPEMEKFWSNVSSVLEEVIPVIGADCAMVVVPETVADRERIVVQAVAHLPPEHFLGRSYDQYDDVFRRVMEKGEVERVPFRNYGQPDTICGSIRELAPAVAAEVHEVILVQVRMGEKQRSLLLFFLNRYRDAAGSLPSREERGMLMQLAFVIGTSFDNHRLYQRQQKELLLRRAWLRRVTHQLLAPLHGLQGYAEDAGRRLRRWQEETSADSDTWTEEKHARWKQEIRRWENSFESVRWSSFYAARLAHNLGWKVYGPRDLRDRVLTLVDDVPGLLIRCARDFQGLARERRIRSVYVDTDSVRPLNERLCVDETLFHQAIGNLLDNAVKYSSPGSDIVVSGEIMDQEAGIRVTNYGIRLRAEDVQTIFDEGYRTREAARVNPTGTGIGLPVARQIIEMHSGTLEAQPSEQTGRGWQTVFVITLPLCPEDC